MRRTWILHCVLLLVVVAPSLAICQGPGEPEARRFTVGQWLEDLDFVVATLRSKHPNLYYRISEQDFADVVAQARDQIKGARSDLESLYAIRRTIATIQDGHTQMDDRGAGLDLVGLRFPFRVDRFTDGVFITVIHQDHKAFLGSQIIAVDGVAMEDVYDVLERSANMDNQFGRIRPALAGLTFARILYGVGITQSVESVELDVITITGEPATLTLESIPDTGAILWSNRLNIGPTAGEYVHPAAVLGSRTPLHLRKQGPDVEYYWFEHVANAKALYVQMNQVANQRGGDETLAEFTDRVWRYVDDHTRDVEKLVLDLRYNDGGLARRIIPFVNEIIKRDHINNRNSLFVLVGKRTYSASVIFLTELVVHTNAVVIGDPPASPFGFFSDTRSVGNLPNSGFGLYVAGRQVDNSWSSDTVYFPPDIPAPFSSRDYFDGIDPGLEIALFGETRTIIDLASEEGAEVAWEEFLRRRQEYADLTWWRGWDSDVLEGQIDRRGYAMMADGQLTTALELFQFAVLLSPESWNAWDSLGEIQYVMKNYRPSRESYRKSVALNPDNENGIRWIERITSELERF